MFNRFKKTNEIPNDVVTESDVIDSGLTKDFHDQLKKTKYSSRDDRPNEERITADICLGTLNNHLYHKLNPKFKWRGIDNLYTKGLHPSFGNHQPDLEDILNLEELDSLYQAVGEHGVHEIKEKRRLEKTRMWCLDYYYRNWESGKTHCEACGGFILDTSNIPKKTNSISSESVYSSFNRVQQAKALDKSFIDYETELVLDNFYSPILKFQITLKTSIKDY